MQEAFLHHLWRLRKFDVQALQTTRKEALNILDFGVHNTNAGPDFLNGKVRIGNTIWAGHIELHSKSSDWLKHQHQNDTAYDNVILHVVYEEDEAIPNPEGTLIPCLELRHRIPKNAYQNYLKLLHTEAWIPCANAIEAVPVFTKNLWLDRLVAERLEQKSVPMLQYLQQQQMDWESTAFQFISQGFGIKINAEAFGILASRLDIQTIAKHRSQLFQLEALLYGQAGLLERDFKDNYPNQLKKEYAFLQKKHQLDPAAPSIWKFLRLRPASFPTVRIAQLASFLQQKPHLFSAILEIESLGDVSDLYQNIQVSDYWKNHYVFDKVGKASPKKIGKNFIQLQLINVIIPLIFLYGKHKQLTKYQEKALDLLESLAPEKNTIIKTWEAHSIKADSAYQSQALLQLKKHYCDQKKCLDCSIGCAILR